MQDKSTNHLAAFIAIYMNRVIVSAFIDEETVSKWGVGRIPFYILLYFLNDISE